MAELTNFNFIDLNKKFTKNIYDDVSLRYDDDAIKDSIRNILLTSKHELPMRPGFGMGIRELLFAPITKKTAVYLERQIDRELPQKEPRIKVLDVTIRTQPDHHRYEITIEVVIVGTRRQVSITFFLERIR